MKYGSIIKQIMVIVVDPENETTVEKSGYRKRDNRNRHNLNVLKYKLL